MFEVICILLVIGVSLFVYQFYIRPKRQCQNYVKIMRAMGYKVYEYPFSFLGMQYVEKMRKDLQDKQDVLYSMKHQYSEYDVLVGNKLGSPNLIFINPKLIKEINTMEKAITLRKDSLLFEIFNFLMEGGLLTVSGYPWKNHRKTLSKVFNYDFLTSQLPLMNQVCQTTLLNFQKIAQRNQKHYHCKLQKILSTMTFLVIITGFLGIDVIKEQIDGQQLAESVFELIDILLKTALNDPLIAMFGGKIIKSRCKASYRKALRKTEEIRAVILKYVQKYKQKLDQKQYKVSDKPQTLIEALLLQNKNGENPYNEKELIDELITFILAGTDTTASFTLIAILQIYKNPNILSKIQSEIDKHIGKDELITIDKLKKLTYIDCIQKEISRMYNPAPGIFGRKTTENTMIADIPIFKGTNLFFQLFPLFYNPAIFEDPFQFKPERWEVNEISQKQNLISLAFSGGPRTCIGKHLALLENKLILVNFIRRYASLEEVGNRKYTVSFAYSCVPTKIILKRYGQQ